MQVYSVLCSLLNGIINFQFHLLSTVNLLFLGFDCEFIQCIKVNYPKCTFYWIQLSKPNCNTVSLQINVNANNILTNSTAEYKKLQVEFEGVYIMLLYIYLLCLLGA